MIGYSVSAGYERISTGDKDWIFMPRDGARGRRGVVLLHGQLQTGQEWWADASPGQTAVAQILAAAGLPMFAVFGEGPGWGIDAVVAELDNTRTLFGNYGAATDKMVIVGASMGAADGLNYMRAHPSRVAGFVGIMPACDLDDIRDNNRNGNGRTYINAAWGMPVGSTSATDPLPSQANPNTTANAASIASSGADIKFYYSSADTVVIPSTVESLASKLGIVPTLISDSVNHSDGLFQEVPLDEMVTFVGGRVYV